MHTEEKQKIFQASVKAKKFKIACSQKNPSLDKQTRKRQLTLSSISSQKSLSSPSWYYSINTNPSQQNNVDSPKYGQLLMKPKTVKQKQKNNGPKQIEEMKKIHSELKKLLHQVKNMLTVIKNYVKKEVAEWVGKMGEKTQATEVFFDAKYKIGASQETSEDSPFKQDHFETLTTKLGESKIQSAVANYLQSIHLIASKLKQKQILVQNDEGQMSPQNSDHFKKTMKINKLKIASSVDNP